MLTFLSCTRGGVTQEDAISVLENIATQKLGDHEKRFLFVDPFGYKDISIANILRLLNGGKTELLLFQPCSFMHRFAEKSTPEALEVFLHSHPIACDFLGWLAGDPT